MQHAVITPPSRREARRHSRREAILDVAAQSFLEHGYAATTMTAIAAALGGSKGTLWSYFPSKDELFGAVLDRATSDFRNELSLTLKRAEGIGKTLTDFCMQLLTKVASPEAVALHRLVVAEVGRFPEIGRIFWERAPLRTHQLLAEFLQDAMARGLLRPEEPLRAARQLIGMTMGGCHQQMLFGVFACTAGEGLEADARGAVDAFLRAYAP